MIPKLKPPAPVQMLAQILLAVLALFHPSMLQGQELLLSVSGSHVAFSPRSQYVCFAGGTANVVRLSTRPLETFILDGAPTVVRTPPAFSPDESVLALARPEVFAGGFIGTAIRTYGVPQGPLLGELPAALHGSGRSEIFDLHWMRTGDAWLALLGVSFDSRPTIRKLSTIDGKTLVASEPLSFQGGKLSVSYASSRIVSADASGSIYVYSLSDLSLERRLTNQIGSQAFAVIAEDGTTIYSGAKDDSLRTYSTSDWQQQRRVKAEQGGVRELAVDRERTIVLTRGYDGTLKGWRAGDLSSLFTVRVGSVISTTLNLGQPYRVQISPDGAYFATTSEYTDSGLFINGGLYTIPLRVTVARREGQSMMLEWCGGRPPFRLQERALVSSGDWADVPGVLESRRLTLPLAGSRFYRIVEHAPGLPPAAP